MKWSYARALVGGLGALGVSAAAFYAHGLQKVASPEQIRWWAIACALQLVTTPVILALVLAVEAKTRATDTESSATRRPIEALPWSARLLSVGVLFFSGSLYLMALGAPRWLGAVTPLGGLLMIMAWGWFVFEGQ